MVKNLPAIAGDSGDRGLILCQEDPLEKELATHSSILAWKTHEAWQATVLSVAKNQTQLNTLTYTQ